MKKFLALFLTMMLTLGALSGCSTTKDNGTDVNNNQDNLSGDNQKDEQIFTFAGSNDIMTLDVSLMNDEMSAIVMYAVNEGLVRFNQGKIIQGIAEKQEISEDGKVYTFYLRDAKWSDGEDVTAHDFVYSFLRTLDPKTGSSQVEEFDSILNAQEYYSGEIEDESKVGIKALDDKTLEITLVEEDPFFLSLVAQGINFYPIRKDYVENFKESYATSPDKFIGCGPFTLTEWAQASSITMEKNQSYWDNESIKLDKVVEYIIPDGNTSIGMYDLGEVDGVYSISALQTVNYPEHGSNVGGTLQHLVFRSEEGKVTSNSNLRKALSFAIDREAIVNAVAAPGTKVSDRMLDPTITYNDEQIADLYKASSNVPSNGDENKAKEYLELALEELNLSSVSELPSLNYVCLDSSAHKQYAEALKARWEKVLGIDVQINIMPVPQAIGSLLSGEFDIFLNGQSTGVHPDTLLKNYILDGSNNYAGWNNEEYTDLILKQQKNSNIQERFEQIQKAEQIILDEAPVAPLWMPGTAYLAQKYVKNLHYGRQTGSIEFIYAYIEK